MINKFEILKYDPKIDKIDNLKKIAESSYQTNLSFFEQPVYDIKINFVYSDEELAKEMSFPFQEWHKALAFNDTVWVFSPHLPKGADCQQHITHEFAHIFTNKLFYEGNPAWLKEGIAYLVAGQPYKITTLCSGFNFKDTHTGNDWQKYPRYGSSTAFVNYLINNFGKNKLFDLLKQTEAKIGKYNSHDQFCELFKTIYPQDFETISQKFIDQFPKTDTKKS